MERLKNMSLRKSFFLLTLCGLLAAVALAAAVWMGCKKISAQYPLGSVTIGSNGMVTVRPDPPPEQLRLLQTLEIVGLLGWVLFPATSLAGAGALFYRWKLKEPIALLEEGTKRIQAHDLDFTIPQPSGDELGKLCGTFETMRAELLRTNRELWRQGEERKRLNAAFAHDLRNPITVLKGSVRLLEQDPADKQALERLGTYTARLERYVEAMSSIQRLEQLPLRGEEVSCAALKEELAETARVLAPALRVTVSGADAGTVRLDHGLFLTVAENLLGNAARYAQKNMEVSLAVDGGRLSLTVADDGPGFPAELLREGPKPFGKTDGGGDHFGMGLYSCALLCAKHGGALMLADHGGATAVASFQINCRT